VAVVANRRKEAVVALSLILPFVFVLSLVFLYPIGKLVYLSFTNAPLIGGNGEWVGLDNFKRVFSDRLFLTSLKNNGYFVLLTVIPTTIIALVIALMVVRLRKSLQALILAFFFLPYILPVSVVTQIWAWMLDFQFGILQPAISLIAGKPVAVFRNPYWVMPVVASVTIWWTNGFNVLLFIAGLQSVDKSVLEAAEIDGTSGWQKFRYVTLPMLGSTVRLSVFFAIVGSLQLFDMIMPLTGGGPSNSTQTMVTFLYTYGVMRMQVGLGSAVGVVLFIICVTLAFGYRRIFMRHD